MAIFCIDASEKEDFANWKKEHDTRLLDKVAEKIRQKMCSENCGERQCVDAMDRCVWYGYVDEVIEELKAKVSE